MKHIILAAGIAVCSVFSMTGTQAQENTTTLTLEQARVAARIEAQKGNLQIAEQIALTLLRKNPNDVDMLALMSEIALAVNNTRAARAFASRAYRLSKDKTTRYEAAIFTAKALQAEGKPERAKLWLRRASQSAQSEAQQENVATGFSILRQISPWTTSLSFGITPSDNINNGTNRRTITLFGLPFVLNDSAPLAGGLISASGSVDYRLWQSQRAQIKLGADVFDRHAWIEPSSRSKTSQTAAAFRYSYIGARISSDQVVGRQGRLRLNQTISTGRAYYGQKPYLNKVGGTISGRWTLNQQSTIGLTFGLSREMNLNNPNRSLVQRSLSIPYNRVLNNGARLGLTLSANDVLSQSASTANRNGQVTVSYTPAKPILNLNPSYSLSYGRRIDKNPSFGAQRSDVTYKFSVSFSAPKLQIYGFIPVVIFEGSRNLSNISLYDTSSLSTRIDFRSSF